MISLLPNSATVRRSAAPRLMGIGVRSAAPTQMAGLSVSVTSTGFIAGLLSGSFRMEDARVQSGNKSDKCMGGRGTGSVSITKAARPRPASLVMRCSADSNSSEFTSPSACNASTSTSPKEVSGSVATGMYSSDVRRSGASARNAASKPSVL